MNLSDITQQAGKVREAEAFLILERRRLDAMIRRARRQGEKRQDIADAVSRGWKRMSPQRITQIEREA
jgi:hypothetical protein